MKNRLLACHLYDLTFRVLCTWGLLVIMGGAQVLAQESYPHLQRYQRDVDYRTQTDLIEDYLYRATLQGDNALSQRGLLTIPVVVHVMHLPGDTNPSPNSSNPTDAQIQAGIDLLNDAFRNRGVYAGSPMYSDAGIPAADIEIEFCLAQLDAAGQPTTGINRVATPLSNLEIETPCAGTNGTQEECLKSLSYWDSELYMNVWLVNNLCIAAGNGCDLKGFAYPASAHGLSFDGPVIEAGVWGNGPEDHTYAVREVGRYFNLLNTHYDPPGPKGPCVNNNCLLDGDKVCDTPPDADGAVVDCSQGQSLNSCSTDADDTTANNPFVTDVQDLYENFMDGGEADCRSFFTPGQKFRMRLALLGIRQSLLFSPGCNRQRRNVSLGALNSPFTLACEGPHAPSFFILNSGDIPVTQMTLTQEVDNLEPDTLSWTGALEVGDSVAVTMNGWTTGPGRHTLKIKLLAVNQEANDEDESDNVIKHTWFQLPNSAPVALFPTCWDFESGDFAEGWMVGNFDGLLPFEVQAHEVNCSERGLFGLRYNTAGSQANGIVAGLEGTRDAVVSPPIDLRGYGRATLSFEVAYRATSPSRDLHLRVSVIEGCEGGLTEVYNKRRLQLATSQLPFDPDAPAWVPDSCTQWRTETIVLDDFCGQEIRLVFDALLQAAYSQNLYIDNICLTAEEACEPAVLTAEEAGAYVADRSCVDAEGWTHYWKSAGAAPATEDDLLLFSVADPHAAETYLPLGGVKVELDSRYGYGGHDLSGSAAYLQVGGGWQVSGRTYHLQANAPVSDSLQVRFYFDAKDTADLHTATGKGLHDLVVYQAAGAHATRPAEGHDQVDAYRESYASDVASQFTWRPEVQGDFLSAEVWLTQWGSVGLGASTEGFGALYPSPLKLTARQDFDDIRLDWETRQEVKTEAFEVYYSTDLRNFSQIGQVDAAGYAAGQRAYSMRDESFNPNETYHYYYVALRHTNGWVLHTDTVLVTYRPAAVVKVFPNPFAEQLSLRIEAPAAAPLNFSLYNSAHQRLLARTWPDMLQVDRQIDLPDLPPGIYYYQIIHAGKVVGGKLIRTP